MVVVGVGGGGRGKVGVGVGGRGVSGSIRKPSTEIDTTK